MFRESIEFHNGLPVRAFVRGGSRSPYHWHDAMEVVQVLKGSAQIVMGNDEVTLRQGDVAIVNTNELHRMAGGVEAEVLHLYIDADFCRSVLPDHYLFFYCGSPNPEAQAQEKYAVLKDYIARLTNLLDRARGDLDAAAVKGFLKEMLAYTARHFDFLRWGFGGEPFGDKCVARLYQIARHTTGDAEVRKSLTDLAVELGVSLQHLSGDIKKKFGMTFQELLCYGRCERAAKLLLETDRRIVEIAEDCGFSDAKYLIKYFKRFFHTTPSDFRRLYRIR